jgi:hypothetical protein
MTSIEWLKDWMSKNQYFIGNDLLEVFEQAKQMHKQEIIDAFSRGAAEGLFGEGASNKEQYYQETFKKD